MPGVDQLQLWSWQVLSPLPHPSIPLHPGIGKKKKGMEGMGEGRREGGEGGEERRGKGGKG